MYTFFFSAQVLLVIGVFLCSATAQFGEKISAAKEQTQHSVVIPDARRELPRFSTRYKNSDANYQNASKDDKIRTVVVAPKIFEQNFSIAKNSDFGIETSQSKKIKKLDTLENKDEKSIISTDKLVSSLPQSKNSNRLRYRTRERFRLNDAKTSIPKPIIQHTESVLNIGEKDSKTRSSVEANKDSREIENDSQLNIRQRRLPYERLRSNPSRRVNDNLYSRWRGRESITKPLTNSRELRFRSHQPITTEKSIIEVKSIYVDNVNSKQTLESNESGIANQKINKNKEKLNEVEESVKFADILQNFQTQKSEVRITKRPSPVTKRLRFILPEVVTSTKSTIPAPNSYFHHFSSSTTVKPIVNNPIPTLPATKFISPTSHIRSTVFQFGPSFSAIEHNDEIFPKPESESLISNHQQFPKFPEFKEAQMLRQNYQQYSQSPEHICSGQTKEGERECRQREGQLPKRILQSTRDIIKQAQSGKNKKSK